MEYSIRLLPREEEQAFKHEMQEAFQKGYEDHFGNTEGIILPFEDIERSLAEDGVIVYEVIGDDERLGGALIVLRENGRKGNLHFLYTKVGCQSRGVGQWMWRTIEALHPDVELWETCTPYFDTRNIHFYVNRLGFHIVEFFNAHHPDPHLSSQPNEDPTGEEGMFRFEKTTNNNEE